MQSSYPNFQKCSQSRSRKYGGTLLRDDAAPLIAGLPTTPTTFGDDGLHLIRVDLQQSSLNDLGESAFDVQLASDLTYSSENAARLMALMMREHLGGLEVGLNVVASVEVIPEHPDGMGGNVDFEDLYYMDEDSGLRIGVVKAWRYLDVYKNLAPSTNVWRRPIVAVIDAGFDLDSEGMPSGENDQGAKPVNIDYFPAFEAPMQADVADMDLTAGGILKGFFGDSRGWHGQHVFSIATAVPRNNFGAAGIGGPVTRPFLIRTDVALFNTFRAIDLALEAGADIINISLGHTCNGTLSFLCALGFEGIDGAVSHARSMNVPVVVAAGNGDKDDVGVDLADIDIRPATSPFAITVGAISETGQAKSFSNYGDAVSIWAPDNTNATVNPFDADFSSDGSTRLGADLDFVGEDELGICSGTSCAAPFVTGVVALMRAANFSLTPGEIETILRNTAIQFADPIPDPRVQPGYVWAFGAVEAAAPNLLPLVNIVSHSEGATDSFRNVSMIAEVVDPELGQSLSGVLTEWSSSVDGVLCPDPDVILPDPPDPNLPIPGEGFPGLICKRSRMTVGVHTIKVKSTDPFGAVGEASVVVEFVNNSPLARINAPINGAVFDSSQTVFFQGVGTDIEDGTLPDASTSWSSDINPDFGVGREVSTALAPGQHTVTLTVVDSSGAIGTDTIDLTITDIGGQPTASITSFPSTLGIGEFGSFTGTGIDPEDGVLSGAQLEWISDKDGLRGTGNSVSFTLSGPGPCPAEREVHMVTLRVTDTNGNIGEFRVMVAVGQIC